MASSILRAGDAVLGHPLCLRRTQALARAAVSIRAVGTALPRQPCGGPAAFSWAAAAFLGSPTSPDPKDTSHSLACGVQTPVPWPPAVACREDNPRAAFLQAFIWFWGVFRANAYPHARSTGSRAAAWFCSALGAFILSSLPPSAAESWLGAPGQPFCCAFSTGGEIPSHQLPASSEQSGTGPMQSPQRHSPTICRLP